MFFFFRRFIGFNGFFDIVKLSDSEIKKAGNLIRMKDGYRLVIIEDEDEIRNGLETIIDWASLGFRVAAGFSSWEEALEWLSGNTPDVILTDIRLGGISGLDICRWAHSRMPSVKLMILSGYSDFDYTRQAIDCKVSKYLLKPVDISELYAAFRALHEEFESTPGGYRLLRQAYLSKEFKRQLGINFKAYINDASVNYAKELLAGTSIRVHEISGQAGRDQQPSGRGCLLRHLQPYRHHQYPQPHPPILR